MPDWRRGSRSFLARVFAFRPLALARRVLVQAVQRLRGVAAEVVLTVRRLLGVFVQLALEVLSPALAAGALHVALQLTQLSFVLVHVSQTPLGRVGFTRRRDPVSLIAPPLHSSQDQRPAGA